MYNSQIYIQHRPIATHLRCRVLRPHPGILLWLHNVRNKQIMPGVTVVEVSTFVETFILYGVADVSYTSNNSSQTHMVSYQWNSSRTYIETLPVASYQWLLSVVVQHHGRDWKEECFHRFRPSWASQFERRHLRCCHRCIDLSRSHGHGVRPVWDGIWSCDEPQRY